MKKKALAMPFAIAVSVLALAGFALKPAAAAESVIIEMQVTISANEEFQVTVCGAGSSCTSNGGSACGSPNQIGFTSTTGDDYWVNASRVGGSTQSASCPIVNVSNTGNVALEINISTDVDIDSIDSCTGGMEMRYMAETFGTGGNGDGSAGADLNVTPVTLWASHGIGDDKGFYLWVNTSGCDDTDDISLGSINLYVNGTQ